MTIIFKKDCDIESEETSKGVGFLHYVRVGVYIFLAYQIGKKVAYYDILKRALRR